MKRNASCSLKTKKIKLFVCFNRFSSYVYSLAGCEMRVKMEAVWGMTEILTAGRGIKNTLGEAGFTQFDPWDAE